MKFVVRENGRNPVKNLPRPRFVHHETDMEGPRRELGTPTSNRLRHEAALMNYRNGLLGSFNFDEYNYVCMVMKNIRG